MIRRRETTSTTEEKQSRTEINRVNGSKGGRPRGTVAINSKIGVAQEKALLKNLEEGNTLTHSCNAVGLSADVVRKEGATNPLFLRKVHKSQALAVKSMIAIIREKADKNWFAAAWWLERLHHEHFGQQPKSGSVGIAQQAMVVKIVTNVQKVSGQKITTLQGRGKEVTNAMEKYEDEEYINTTSV